MCVAAISAFPKFGEIRQFNFPILNPLPTKMETVHDVNYETLVAWISPKNFLFFVNSLNAVVLWQRFWSQERKENAGCPNKNLVLQHQKTGVPNGFETHSLLNWSYCCFFRGSRGSRGSRFELVSGQGLPAAGRVGQNPAEGRNFFKDYLVRIWPKAGKF